MDETIRGESRGQKGKYHGEEPLFYAAPSASDFAPYCTGTYMDDAKGKKMDVQYSVYSTVYSSNGCCKRRGPSKKNEL